MSYPTPVSNPYCNARIKGKKVSGNLTSPDGRTVGSIDESCSLKLSTFDPDLPKMDWMVTSFVVVSICCQLIGIDLPTNHCSVAEVAVEVEALPTYLFDDLNFCSPGFDLVGSALASALGLLKYRDPTISKTAWLIAGAR
jgi:hypothetical protein